MDGKKDTRADTLLDLGLGLSSLSSRPCFFYDFSTTYSVVPVFFIFA